MSRRGRRKARREEDATLVLHFEDGEIPVRITVPGVTRGVFRKVARLARAGRLNDPVVRAFTFTFAAAVVSAAGDDLSTLTPWTEVDERGVLEMLGLVDVEPGGWTAADDEALARLLDGGCA